MRAAGPLPAMPLACGVVATAILLTAPVTAISVAVAGLVFVVGMYAALLRGRPALWSAATGVLITASAAVWLQPAALPSACASDTPCSLRGVVESTRENAVATSALVTVRTVDGRTVPPFRLRLSTMGAAISPGDDISFRAVVEPASADTGIYALYALSERLTAVAYAPQHAITILGRRSGLSYSLTRLRHRMEETVEASALSSGSAGLLSAACLGTGEAPSEVRESFRRTSLSHLLCVSGFHVSIVAWLFGLFLIPLHIFRRGRRQRYLLLIVLVWLFVALTGLQPSAVRAAIMLSVFYISRLGERTASPYNTLLLAVAVVLCFNPYWLWSPGFQMSVAAVAGLIAFADVFNPVPGRYSKIRSVVMLVAVPFAAMVGTLPVVILWFGRLSLLSVPVNALAALIFPVFMVSGVLTVLLGSSLPATWSAAVADSCYRLLMKICDTAVAIDTPVEDVQLSTAGLVAVTVIVTAAAIVLNARTTRLRLLAAAATLTALATLLALA